MGSLMAERTDSLVMRFQQVNLKEKTQQKW